MKRNKNGLTESEFLEQYNPGDYEKPSVTVDMMVLGLNHSLSTLKILLIKRNDHPYIDTWALPGGFVEINESAYEAANRELKEETNLSGLYLEQLYTMTNPKRDPRMRVIDIAYIALVNEIQEAKAGDDAGDAKWFDVSFTENNLIFENEELGIKIEYELTKKIFENGVIKYTNYTPELISEDALAFDHIEIVLEGLMRLRNKLEYTDIAFNLLPEMFTLSDLQRVYELLLGHPVYKKTFRDQIASKVIALDMKDKSITGKKASTIYKYKRQ